MIENYKQFHKTIREICKKNGWEIFFVYNDKNKTFRRISYFRNGWIVPVDMKIQIQNEVQKFVDDSNINGEVYWIESSNFRSRYDRLCIKIPF